MPRLFQPLPEGPLDIIGDVHGEIDALRALLVRLGVDVDRKRAQRPLIFVGDLIDRGPDSVAVVDLVADLAQAGLARCILGNHELNVLAEDRKEGNGWILHRHEDHPDGWHLKEDFLPFESRAATAEEASRVLAFLAELPLGLERDDLRVVHACWHEEARSLLPEAGEVVALVKEHDDRVQDELRRSGLEERAKEQLDQLNLDANTVPHGSLYDKVAERDAFLQMGNPIKVVTSGPERATTELPRRIGGKMRFVEREPWWDTPRAKPTVVGHYWRRRAAIASEKPDPWSTKGFAAWSGNAFCVDYSVGYRYRERVHGPPARFHGGLAALRWPECALVFDDEDAWHDTGGPLR
jgi:hypothetical protein